MLKFQGWKKKILAAMTATALSVSLSFGAPAKVEAASAIDLIGAGIVIGAEAAKAKAQVDANIRHYNETEAGSQELYNGFREKCGVNRDPVYNAMLDRIMTNLTNAVAKNDPSIREKPYKYFVAEDETLNAWCTMGHVMAVNVGTFKILANEDEIAAVVGHEMGHGQKDHSVKAQKKHLQKAITATVLGTAVGATIGGGAITSLVTSVALTHSVAHGDRKQETEADLVGFDYIVDTEYNIGACAAVMQKFVEMEGGQRSGFEKFFNPSDHPDSAKRRDACAKKITEYSGGHVTAKDGVVCVNKKTFAIVAASSNMSSVERSYFVMGNLARAYHNGQNKYEATVQNGTVMLGNQAIITPIAGDEDAYTLAKKLNSIK